MSKQIIYLLLAVSFGLNVGMVATTLMHRSSSESRPSGSGLRDGGPGFRDDDPGPPDVGPGPGPGLGGPRDPERMVENHLRGMTEHLDLDADQQRALRAIMTSRAALLVEIQARAHETGRRVADIYSAPDFDPERFKRAAAEASIARARLDSLSAEMLAAEAVLLTPEQRRKFAQVAPTLHNRPPRERGPQEPPRDRRPPPAPRDRRPPPR